MSSRNDRKTPPSIKLCLAIFLAVCFGVGLFNWLSAPRDPVTVQPAEASTAAPWVCTADATAIPTATPAPTDAPGTAEDTVTGTWVLNTSSMRFHLPGCSSVPTIKEKNRSDFTGPRQELIDQGYKPCGVCKP